MTVHAPTPEVEAREKGTTEPRTGDALTTTRRYKFRSVFLLALAIFFAGNAAFSFLEPVTFDPYKFNYRGWSWWTFNSLRQTRSVSNIALLGSSTMVSAHAGADANFLNQSLDMTSHHRSKYLEHKLTGMMPGSFQTFSLAAPGQMPSDAYITLKGMVASHSRPDVVIYGLAPRDFIDGTLTAPGDTDAFKFLTRLVNINDVAFHVFRSPWSKLDWSMQRLIYLYGCALDVRLAMGEALTGALDRVLPRPKGKEFTWWDRTKLLPGYLPAEICPDAIMSGPLTRQEADTHYTDNTMEYIQRYKNPDRQVYKTQMYFMTKLAEFCKRERIELVLVNMPVTLDNLKLLKPGAYIGYIQHLKEFAMVHGLSFYELNNFARYDKRDFHDSVHLNAFGGQKFFDDVAASINADPRVKKMVSMSGEHLSNQIEIEKSESNKRSIATPALDFEPTF